MSLRGYTTRKNCRIFKVMEDLGDGVLLANYLKITGEGIEGDLFKFHKEDVIFLEDISTKLSYTDRKLIIRLASAGLTIKPDATVHGETYSSTCDKIKHAMSEIKRGYPLSEELRDIYIEYIKYANRVSD